MNSGIALIIVEAVKLAREAMIAVQGGNPTADQLAITRALTQAKVDAAVAEIDAAIAMGKDQ